MEASDNSEPLSNKAIVEFREKASEEVATILKSDLKSGLTRADVEERLKQFGYNEVVQKKTHLLTRFARKFWGLTAWMLEITIILSLALQKYFDAYVITALLVFNSLIGFYQEQKASSAVEALKMKLHVNARVLRSGSWELVSARELVPGDIIRIRAGDFVPADAKVFAGESAADQSMLTGESTAVEVRRNGELYSGSVIRRGEVSAIVTSTGKKTYFGKTAELVQIARPKLHMENVVSQVVKWLLIIVSVSLGSAALLSILRGTDVLDIVPLILILLVSALPVALPAMFTVSMALGSVELAKKGVLVTKLSASEDAATMDVLCADKTGTITMNQLSITNVIPLNGFNENDVIFYGSLASQEANQDPIDVAFIKLSEQKNLADDSYVQKEFVPFDPQTRKTEATIQKDSQTLRVVKGAVSVIVKECAPANETAAELATKMEEFGKKGYRTLAVAKANSQGKTELVGIVALYDLPRPDSRKLVKELKDLGVSVKMLTGDSLQVAQEIASDVGLTGEIVRVSDLKASMKESPIEAALAAEKSGGFAEIYPEDKYAIVKSLQASEHTVGMTGDGINDAPALKQAEVGIAVSNATDVAKGAASVVLTNEGLSNIVDLVKVGRMIYQRMVTWILNKVVKDFLVVVFVILAFLTTGQYIVSTFNIVLLLFVTDFVTIALSTDRVRWSRKPDAWKVTGLVKVAAVIGCLVVTEALGLFYVGSRFFNIMESLEHLHTFAFETLFFFSIFSIFIVRESEHFWKSVPSRLLISIIAIDIAAVTLLSTLGIPGLYPIPLAETMVVITYSAASTLAINDLVKVQLRSRIKLTSH